MDGAYDFQTAWLLTCFGSVGQNLFTMSDHNRVEQRTDREPDDHDLRIAFGQRIRRLRERKGWRRADLARRIKVDKSYLLRWEKGALPPLGKLIILSEVLEASLDALLAGREVDIGATLAPDQRKAIALQMNRLASLLGLRAKK